MTESNKDKTENSFDADKNIQEKGDKTVSEGLEETGTDNQTSDKKTGLQNQAVVQDKAKQDEASGAQKVTSKKRKPKDPNKTPLILKILAVLLIIVAALAIPTLILVIIGLALEPDIFGTNLGISSFVIGVIQIAALFLSAALGAAFGINLLRNKRRNARQACEVLIVLTIIALLCDVMLNGLSIDLVSYAVRLVILIVIATYIDPALSEERRLHRRLKEMEERDQAEEGTLGRDETGKGYIKLDFFNIFWIFVIGCVVGVVIETIYHFMLYGEYQNRTGMLYGPFSPIYGFGAVLMTVALNRFYKKSFILIFFTTAVIGGAFEYAVSWFMEFAFGIVAWDYTGTFLSIDGRTNGMYMVIWGILGCIWIKLLLPYVLKLINLIPWNWRYVVTTVCAALMIANGVLTLGAYDSWYQRQAGNPPTNALEKFCDTYYNDEFMESRFQSMSIDPDKSTRTGTSAPQNTSSTVSASNPASTSNSTSTSNPASTPNPASG